MNKVVMGWVGCQINDHNYCWSTGERWGYIYDFIFCFCTGDGIKQLQHLPVRINQWQNWCKDKANGYINKYNNWGGGLSYLDFNY